MALNSHCDLRTAAPNRMQKRAQRTRARLLSAAAAIFGAKGVEASTVEEITERADLGKGTFYRHFASKEDVAIALTDDSVGRLMVEMRKAATGLRGIPEVLMGLLRAHTGFFLQRRAEFVLLFQGRLLLRLEGEDTTGLEKPFADYLSLIEELVAPFAPAPVNAAKVRRVACGLVGFVSGVLSLASVGLAEREMEAGLGPLRTAFVAGCTALLTELTPPAAVSAAHAGTGPSPAALAASAPPPGANKVGVTR